MRGHPLPQPLRQTPVPRIHLQSGDPQADISLFDEQKFSFEQSALVIGNEANGVSDPTLGKGVTIPMPGHAESLNAAQAATVFLCEAVRRNLFKGR